MARAISAPRSSTLRDKPWADISPASAAKGTRVDARVTRRSARLLRMRKPTRPRASCAKAGATASATVFSMLAPMASRQSMCRCTTRRRSGKARISMPRQPPPNWSNWGRTASAMPMISRRAARSAAVAPAGSATSRNSTCAIMIDSSVSATKPPPARAIRAAFEAAAMTDGSSTAMGMRRSTPLMRKLSPRPSGRA